MNPVYVDTRSEDACFNFGVEYYFASEKPFRAPVFLFWRTKPTLMVGKYQNTYEEIDLAYAREHGIDVVRRMSGGGTIYTDPGGWQYSFIAGGGGETICFDTFLAPVLRALRDLGLDAAFSGRNDILIGGKKISGTAQYKLAGSTVHHGSLLFDTDIGEMARSTTVDEGKISSKGIRSVRERVTNIREHLRTGMDAEAFRDYMVRSIAGENAAYVLSDSERDLCDRLADEHFRPWKFRFGANPRFSMTKSGRFPGGSLTIRLDASHGTIDAIFISGDFFAGENAERLAGTLAGCPLERSALLERLYSADLGNAILGVSAEELTNLLLS